MSFSNFYSNKKRRSIYKYNSRGKITIYFSNYFKYCTKLFILEMLNNSIQTFRTFLFSIAYNTIGYNKIKFNVFDNEQIDYSVLVIVLRVK